MRWPEIENRKARYDYFTEESLECGISLWGNEVKSLRDGQASIKDAWIVIENGELLLKKMNVTPWSKANSFDVDPIRPRKLLAHKDEIRRLKGKVDRDGYTLIPLKVYFKDGKVKVLVGLCKGKKTWDKRDDERARSMDLVIKRCHL